MTKINLSRGLYKPPINNIAKNSDSLDTLAQLGTTANSEPNFTVSNTTKSKDKKTLVKRSRRKYLSTGLTLNLVKASEQNEKSTLGKSYWNTFHCSNILLGYSDGKIAGKYCKNRWCMVCNSIRTAQLINKYKPILNEWDDKYFVTLTIPNCKGDNLKMTINEMQLAFSKIHAKFKKRNQRKKGLKFIGLRKLECTYNPDRNDYHPHFHLIVRGEKIGNDLIKSWLNIFNSANRDAQDIRIANDESCVEMFKYFTKVISKTKKGDSKIYADSMDVIFNSIKGKRTFQSFGFIAGKVEEIKEEVNKDLPVEIVYKWIQILADWVDEESGELLTGYVPNEGMKKLVTEKIIVRTNYNSS